jgi:hypothetical protein
MAQSIAAVDFSVVPLESPRAPDTLTVGELAHVLDLLPVVEEWTTAVRARVFDLLASGEQVPGYKLVEKRANRKWADASVAEAHLISAKIGPEEYNKTELKSPAQIEKLVGKKTFATELSTLVVKRSSGYNVVPTSDPRPAASLSAGEDFKLIESTTSEDTP